MNDDAIFLIYRVDCIAGKPPPTFVVRWDTALNRQPIGCEPNTGSEPSNKGLLPAHSPKTVKSFFCFATQSIS